MARGASTSSRAMPGGTPRKGSARDHGMGKWYRSRHESCTAARTGIAGSSAEILLLGACLSGTRRTPPRVDRWPISTSAISLSRRGARNPEHLALLHLIGTLAAAATDQPVAAPEMSAIAFVENAARLRAAHYREEGDRFRSMAETEPLAALRRHLAVLARQYEQIAADLEPKARD